MRAYISAVLQECTILEGAHVLTEEVDKALGGFRIFQSNYWVEPPTSDADQNPGSQSVFLTRDYC